MKYIQVQEIYQLSCDGCVHHTEDEKSTAGCTAQLAGKRPYRVCGNGIWIEDTGEARNAHALLLITKRLT